MPQACGMDVLSAQVDLATAEAIRQTEEAHNE